MISLTKASVYWIHLQEHDNPATAGYIGVSKDVDQRIKQHINDIKNGKHTNAHLVHAANKYGIEKLIINVLLIGEEKFCYEFESSLRPKKAIGWNISPGGHRGPGRNIGSPSKKRSPEEQVLFETKQRLKKERADQARRERQERQARTLLSPPIAAVKKESKKEAKRKRHLHNIKIREEELVIERAKLNDSDPVTRHNSKMRVWELETQIARYRSWL